MLKGLFRDSVIYSAATILSRGLAVLTLPLYTRLLSPSDYGVLDIVSILIVLANLIVPLEIGQGLARFWNEETQVERRVLLGSTALSFSIMMYSVFLLVGLISAEKLSSFFFVNEGYADAVRLGVFLAASNGVFFCLQNQFRWLLRPKDYALAAVIHGTLLAGLGYLLAYSLESSLHGVLLGQITAACVAAAFAAWRLRGWLKPALVGEMLQRMLGFSWPLAISGIFTYASLYASRLLMNHLSSLEDVARYGLAVRVASLITLLMIGIQSALTPIIYASHKDPETPAKIAKLFSGFIAVALVFCLCMALFSTQLVAIFGPPSYADAAPLIALLAPAALLSQLYVFSPGISIAKKGWWQLGVFSVSAMVSVGASYYLIPREGLLGAALASLLSSVVFVLLWFGVGQLFYRIPFDFLRTFCAALLCGVLIFLDGVVLPGLFSSTWLFMFAKISLVCMLLAILRGLGIINVWIFSRGESVH